MWYILWLVANSSGFVLAVQQVLQHHIVHYHAILKTTITKKKCSFSLRFVRIWILTKKIKKFEKKIGRWSARSFSGIFCISYVFFTLLVFFRVLTYCRISVHTLFYWLYAMRKSNIYYLRHRINYKISPFFLI